VGNAILIVVGIKTSYLKYLFLCLTYNVQMISLIVMIHTFSCKYTEKLYRGIRVARFQAFVQQAEKRMQILDSATCIEDLMMLPSNRFEALSGVRKGQFSIRINKQWRICFSWCDDGASHVEIVDYH